MAVCPFADQTRRYDGAYPGSYIAAPPRGCLHTTEGASLPAYSGGAVAPHFTVDVDLAAKTTRVWQHFDTARPARALVHTSTQTNNANCIQVELVGTCVLGGPGLFWPQAPQWAIDGAARLMRWIEADRGIPRTATARPWLTYPQSYGQTLARMTDAEWLGFTGWCGHLHVPTNQHGDPGNLPIAALLAAGQPTTPPPPGGWPTVPLHEEPEMILTPPQGTTGPWLLLAAGRVFTIDGDGAKFARDAGIKPVQAAGPDLWRQLSAAVGK